MRALLAVALAASLLLAAPAAFADRPSSATASAASAAAANDEAARLKKDGDDAFVKLRYADALRAYDASYQKKANPALDYNRGRALEALERYVEAVDAYERFLRDAPPELRERTSKLGEHVAELRTKIATIDLRVRPTGAKVLLRNVAVGTAPLVAPLRVTAGPATIDVEAENYQPAHRELVLKGGTTQVVGIELQSKGSTAPPPEAESSGGGLTSQWWFWAGAGALVIGATVVTIVLVSDKPEPRSGDIGTGRLSAPLLRF
jgi:hypothetical protein